MQEGAQKADRNRALLAHLQDELAQVTSAREVIDTTGSLLAAHLDISFVSLTQVDPDQQAAGLYVMWSDGRMPPFPDRGHLADYVSGDVVAALRRGETAVCRDAEGDPRAHGDAVGAIGLRSWVVVPFRRGGDLLSIFSVADRKAHDWRDDEVELLGDVAVRVLPRLERARAADALRASEERFRTIVTTANEGISMMGKDGRITFVNDVLAKSLGYGPDELIGRRPAELSADHDTARVESELRERVGGRTGRYDLRVKKKTGEMIWFLINASPIYDADGGIVGAVALFTDIDERKKQEAALAFQAHLLANVHDAICALDASYRITYWNEAAEELFGWTREEAIGRLSRDLLEANVQGMKWDDALQALLDEDSFRREVHYRHKDGREIWAEVHSRLIRAEGGEVEGVIAAFRDIREQKRAQQALTWEAARLRAIVEAAPVGLGIVAADGEVLTRNAVLRKIWAGEAPVHSIDEFEAYKAYWPETGSPLGPQDWPAAQALEHGRSIADMVVDIEKFDGTRGTIVLSTAPIEDEGRVLGAVTIVQDITRIRENEQALKFLTDEVRTLHETVVMDGSLTSTELAGDVVMQAHTLLASEGSSIFLLSEDGSLRRAAGVGAPDPEGVDDLVAQTIGERTAVVRHLPPPEGEASGSRGIVLLGVPLMIGGQAQPPESAEGPPHEEDIVFGALAFTYQNRRSLDDNRVRIARAFADQAALAIENARLRARIEEAAIEAERTRLARDLHDSVTQSLFAASLKAEALAEMLDDPEVARNAVEELRRLTRGSLAGMRTMLLEMRVDALTQTPLPELLRHLVEAGGGRIGADVRLNVEGRRQQLPPDVQTALYRVAQEALNNVARHARAGEAWVDLRLGDHRVRLEIGDDGHGFDPDTESAGHFGLRNMRERAEAIGGRFGIVTGPGRGTVVTVEWPLKEGEDHA